MKYKLLLIFLSLIGTSIALLATSRHGAGVTPDSVTYIATARHLADGLGFITYDNTPLLAQPPLYPTLLGFIDLVFGVDPFTSAKYINAIFLGVTIYLFGLLFFKYLSPVPAILGSLTLLVSNPLIKVSFMVWSEPLFNFLVVFYLLALSMYQEKKTRISFSLLSLSVALACLTRYIGIGLVLTGAISILLIQHKDLKTKLSRVLTFTFVSILPLSIWIGRNYLLSNTLFGQRYTSLHSLSDNIGYAFDTLLRWYMPSGIAKNRPALALICLFVGFLMGVIFTWGKRANATRSKETRLFIIFVILFIAAYSGFLIVSSTTTHFDEINDRLLSPIVIPTTLLLFLLFEHLSKLVKEQFPTKRFDILLVVLVVLWLLYPARKTGQITTQFYREGNGYSTPAWKNSQTLQYIHDNDLSECTMYSNGVDVIHFLLDMNAELLPAKQGGANTIADIESLEGNFPMENQACIIWFEEITRRNYLFTLDELLSVTNIEQRIQFADGTIHVVSKK